MKDARARRQATQAISRFNRISSNVAVIGASHDAQMFIDGSTQLGKTNLHWLNIVNADPRVGQALHIAYNGAVSGYRADQYLQQLDAAISSNAGILLLGEGDVNDLACSGMTADLMWYGWQAGAGPSGSVASGQAAFSASSVGIEAAAIRALAAGMRVIMPGSWGQSSGMNATTWGHMQRVNQRRREFCDKHPNCIYIERLDIMLDGSATIGAQRANFTYDGTHASATGGHWIGRRATEKLLQWGIPTRARRSLGAASEVYANGSVQKLLGVDFAGATGTSSGSGTISGTKPASWDINTPAGFTVAAAVQAETGVLVDGVSSSLAGNLKELVLTITAGGAGTVRLQQYLAPSGLLPSDVWQGGLEWSVDSGHANFYGVALDVAMQMDGATNRNLRDGYTQTTPLDYKALPSAEAITRVMKTRAGSAVGTTGSQWYFNVNCVFGGAGSATVRIRAPWLRRVSV